MCSAYVQTFDRSGGLIPSRRSRRKYGRVETDSDGTTWLMRAPQQKVQASSQATTRLVSIPNKVDGGYDEAFFYIDRPRRDGIADPLPLMPTGPRLPLLRK